MQTALALRPILAVLSLASKYATAEVAVQFLNMVSGFVIVRALAKSEYALYTIGITGMTALVVLSNSGIVDAALAIGGRLFHEDGGLARVVATAIRLRYRVAAVFILPSLAVLALLLYENGASRTELAVILLLVTAYAGMQMSTSILFVLPRLRGEIRRIQGNNFAGALIRTLLVFAVAAFHPDAAAIISLGVVSIGVQLVALRRSVRPLLAEQQAADPAIRAEMVSVVKRQWFNDLYYVFQGQMTILLLGFFASPVAVADAGALGRIAVIFVVIAAVMNGVMLPRYARSQDVARIRVMYLLIVATFAAVVAALAGLALLEPGALLWFLGPKYRGLHTELVLGMLNGGVAALAGATWALNSSRAWFIPAWINVPVTLLIQVGLMAIIGVGSVDQVFLVGIGLFTGSMALNVTMTLIMTAGFSRLPAPRRLYAS